ncbi:MAG: DUF4760 domain-containing protein [Candidatus Thioglobus sp.]|nr:DUF4760 domain-containing protein [Candidatus Thioglobus sp.]
MDIETIQTFVNSQASTSIAGFLIIIVSVIAINSQRKTARQKASLEFLDKLSSKLLIESAKFLRDYHKKIALITTSNTTKYKELQEKIEPILNYFESVSIGVRIGIYDRRTMFLSRKQQIIHTFYYSKPYIEEIRKRLDNNCLFENLEWLAKKSHNAK